MPISLFYYWSCSIPKYTYIQSDVNTLKKKIYILLWFTILVYNNEINTLFTKKQLSRNWGTYIIFILYARKYVYKVDMYERTSIKKNTVKYYYQL